MPISSNNIYNVVSACLLWVMHSVKPFIYGSALNPYSSLIRQENVPTFFSKKILFIYMRESMGAGGRAGGEWKGKADSLLSMEQMWGLILGTRDCDLCWSQMFNQRSYPGTPKWSHFLSTRSRQDSKRWLAGATHLDGRTKVWREVYLYFTVLAPWVLPTISLVTLYFYYLFITVCSLSWPYAFWGRAVSQFALCPHP